MKPGFKPEELYDSRLDSSAREPSLCLPTWGNRVRCLQSIPRRQGDSLTPVSLFTSPCLDEHPPESGAWLESRFHSRRRICVFPGVECSDFQGRRSRVCTKSLLTDTQSGSERLHFKHVCVCRGFVLFCIVLFRVREIGSHL